MGLSGPAAGELPGYARLVGAVPRPEYGWVHDLAGRQTRYHDVYTPLTSPDWRAGDPVTLLQEDSTVLGDDPAPAAPASPVEGRLERGSLPGASLAGVVMTLVFGAVFSLFFLIAALGWLYRRNALMRAAPAA